MHLLSCKSKAVNEGTRFSYQMMADYQKCVNGCKPYDPAIKRGVICNNPIFSPFGDYNRSYYCHVRKTSKFYQSRQSETMIIGLGSLLIKWNLIRCHSGLKTLRGQMPKSVKIFLVFMDNLTYPYYCPMEF